MRNDPNPTGLALSLECSELASALRHLVEHETNREDGSAGLALILECLAKKVDTIANRLDDENWKPARVGMEVAA